MADAHTPDHGSSTGASGDDDPDVTAAAGPSASPEEPASSVGAGARSLGGEVPDGPDDGIEVDLHKQAIDVDIEELVAKNQEYLDLLRRTKADFENFRKRAQKDHDDAVLRELGGFVERLLPVLDACDAAAAQGQADAVEPIVSALYSALQREGLERIEPKGDAFDPAVAEAVVHEPGEGDVQVVAEVLRTGYRWKGRLLRPALVKVTD